MSVDGRLLQTDHVCCEREPGSALFVVGSWVLTMVKGERNGIVERTRWVRHQARGVRQC